MIDVRVFRHTADQPFRYPDAERLQRELAQKTRLGFPGALLRFEPGPAITLGKRATADELLVSREELTARGIEVQTTSRGGLATYHGPGQWVAFPVDRLEALTGDPRGVRRAVEALLEAALATARAYQPEAEIRQGCELGVWGPSGKLASVGIQIDQGVLQHGVALNGRRTETSFFGLRPCGLDAPVGFLLEGEQALGAQGDAEFLRLGELFEHELLARLWQT